MTQHARIARAPLAAIVISIGVAYTAPAASRPITPAEATCSDHSNERSGTAQQRAKSGRGGGWKWCGGNLHRPATTASSSARRYRGYVDVLNGRPTREATQGAGWRAIFRERAAGRVRYKVCLRHLGNGAQRCWRRRTGPGGRSRVFVALYVNDRGGPGTWRARWRVGGRIVSSWRFNVRPEFGM